MKNLKIELEGILEEKIYKHLMGEYWDKIENMRREIHEEVQSKAKEFAKLVAVDLLQQIKKNNNG